MLPGKREVSREEGGGYRLALHRRRNPQHTNGSIYIYGIKKLTYIQKGKKIEKKRDIVRRQKGKGPGRKFLRGRIGKLLRKASNKGKGGRGVSVPWRRRFELRTATKNGGKLSAKRGPKRLGEIIQGEILSHGSCRLSRNSRSLKKSQARTLWTGDGSDLEGVPGKNALQ